MKDGFLEANVKVLERGRTFMISFDPARFANILTIHTSLIQQWCQYEIFCSVLYGMMHFASEFSRTKISELTLLFTYLSLSLRTTIELILL